MTIVRVAAFAVALAPALAHAGDFKERAEVRLIDGGVLSDGVTRLAGLEIVLDPEWKTYWRSPGDSGIPPHMDFAASTNVDGVTVEWPAPELHFDGYGWVIGYTDAVVFPLLVRPQKPGETANLNVKLDYAVCKDICIPAEAEVGIVLDGAKPRVAEIDFYRVRVPTTIAGPTETGGVVSTDVAERDGKPVLDLHVRFPSADDDVFAIVEGPEGWYLPVPTRTGTDTAGNTTFEVPLDGVSDRASISGATIRVTGVSPEFSFEQSVTLD